MDNSAGCDCYCWIAAGLAFAFYSVGALSTASCNDYDGYDCSNEPTESSNDGRRVSERWHKLTRNSLLVFVGALVLRTGVANSYRERCKKPQKKEMSRLVDPSTDVTADIVRGVAFAYVGTAAGREPRR